MKLSALIIAIVLLACPVLAVPNVAAIDATLAGAEQAAQKTAAELAAAQSSRDAWQHALSAAEQASGAKDTVIKDRDGTITVLTGERDEARSWGTRFKIGVLNGIGAAFAVALAYTLLTRQFTDAVVCGFISAVFFAGSSAIVKFDLQIATAALWAGGGLAVCGLIYLCYSAWDNRNAAEEHANILPLITKAGILTTDQIRKIDAIAYQETGRLADRIRERVTGKSKAKIIEEATSPTPVAPSVTVPVSVPVVAVTSGVVTPVGP